MSTGPSKEEIQYITNTAALIQTTNLDSMEGIKNLMLDTMDRLYADSTATPSLRDIKIVIEAAHDTLVKNYKTYQEGTLAGITEANPGEINEKVEQLHEITEDILVKEESILSKAIAAARNAKDGNATPKESSLMAFTRVLMTPPSKKPSNKEGGMYYPKKPKRSRKHNRS
jgi:hypothetical protein